MTSPIVLTSEQRGDSLSSSSIRRLARRSASRLRMQGRATRGSSKLASNNLSLLLKSRNRRADEPEHVTRNSNKFSLHVSTVKMHRRPKVTRNSMTNSTHLKFTNAKSAVRSTSQTSSLEIIARHLNTRKRSSTLLRATTLEAPPQGPSQRQTTQQTSRASIAREVSTLRRDSNSTRLTNTETIPIRTYLNSKSFFFF